MARISLQKGPNFVKERAAASTRKKVVVLLMDRTPLRGYLNAASLGKAETIDLLTPDGEHVEVAVAKCEIGLFCARVSGDV